MDFSIYQSVEMFCPNCGHKITGYLSEDGALRIMCDRCKVVIYSKRKNVKEFNIKVTNPYAIKGVG
ncbi:MAG: zinc ribbon domain-containing protein [Clostridia bacterium]|nr:zinc ribbon domain-containing protein [Clostridia bacterium]